MFYTELSLLTLLSIFEKIVVKTFWFAEMITKKKPEIKNELQFELLLHDGAKFYQTLLLFEIKFQISCCSPFLIN